MECEIASVSIVLNLRGSRVPLQTIFQFQLCDRMQHFHRIGSKIILEATTTNNDGIDRGPGKTARTYDTRCTQ